MSSHLSESQKTLYAEGKTLNQDSKYNDSELKSVVNELKDYAETLLAPFDFTIIIIDKILTKTVYDEVKLQYPDFPDVDYTNDGTSIKPDGGIMFAVNERGDKYAILISEDKVQGTNDLRMAAGLKRQATGNAIERGAKNLNLAKTMCNSLNYFPYLIFASGCDFHKSETIARRLEQMNGLMPNHYIDVGNKESSVEQQLEKTLNNINIMKQYGNREYATVCIKTHKCDELPHGSSNWTREERINICKKVIQQSVEEIKKTL
jgi:hypothetical protein